MLRRCVSLQSTRLSLQPCRQTYQIGDIHAIRLPRRYASNKSIPSSEAINEATPTKSKNGKWKVFAVVAITGFTIGSWWRILTRSNAPSTTKFQPHDLVSIEPVSSTASIFTLLAKHAPTNPKAIYNFDFLQPQLQIVRAYTPLPPYQTRDNEVSFLIRHDGRGEMSSYLHRLPASSRIDLRGPNIEYDLKDSKHVIFIAGGTGIAPAMQVAHAMFDCSEEEKARKTLQILWANRRREDCQDSQINTSGHKSKTESQPQSSPASGLWSGSWLGWGKGDVSVAEAPASRLQVHEESDNKLLQRIGALEEMSGGRVSVSTFVDEDKTYIHTGTLQEALKNVMSSSDATGPVEVIVSGPPGFITYIAGPKEWKDGTEQQGVVGGRLAQALKAAPSNVKVWKV